MPRSPLGRTSLVMVGATGLGLAATLTTNDVPPGAVAWPVGLLTGAALLQNRWGGYVVLQVGVFAIALTHLAGGAPLAHSIGVGVAQTVGAAAVIGVVTRFGRHRHALMMEEADIVRTFLGSLVGAVVAAATIGVWSWVTSAGDVRATMLGLGFAHLGSQLVLLPWFLRSRRHSAVAGRIEQGAAWIITLGVAVVVFSAAEGASVAFAVIVCLSWGARRLGTSEILAQLLAVVAIATVATRAGHGPFVGDTFLLVEGDDRASLILPLFVIACALVVVPLVMTVAVHLESLRDASLERDRVQQILERAESVVVIGGDLEVITYFSPGAERLLGHRAADVVGRRLRLMSDAEVERLCDELGAHDFTSLCHALIADGRPYEIRILRKDGVERTHLASLRTIAHGDHLEYVLISEDVTARVEEQQAHEAAVSRLQEIDVAKDTFVSGVSHELRTPLTTMTGFLELLVDGSLGPVTAGQVDALQRIGSNNQRLLALVDDLLSFSRLGGGDLVVERLPLDLRDVVRAACDLVEPTWVARRQTVEVVLPDRPVVVLGDRALVERVVLNLVGNAVKFTLEGGRVDVVLSDDAGAAALAVSDTGIGIPADEVDRLFDRFFRSRVARERAVQGSGLGLSIAKGVVDAHDGTIEVASIEGVGTTVTARLPLHQAHADGASTSHVEAL